jgi:HK97 family phage major capsid protein
VKADAIGDKRFASGRGFPGMPPVNVFEPAPRGLSNDVTEARHRLATLQLERRDLSSTGWLPAAPTPVGDAFQTSARARGPLADALPNRPLPDNGGLLVSAPRFGTSASAAVQVGDLAAVSETDPSSGLNSSNIATVSGMLDVSAQVFDLGYPDIDTAIAAELGEAIAVAIDAQIVNGSNAAGQTQGLLALANIQANTFVDVSPTVGEANHELWGLFSDMSLKSDPDLLVMHPRRFAWFHGQTDRHRRTTHTPTVPGRGSADCRRASDVGRRR